MYNNNIYNNIYCYYIFMSIIIIFENILNSMTNKTKFMLFRRNIN